LQLIANIGKCFMSQCDIIELMENGDCMCLSLFIEKHESSLVDATKIIIKKIIPQFMSADYFLDSTSF